MKRLLFASGGSGGHLAPAIALAQRCGQETGVESWIGTTRKQVDLRMQRSYPTLRFVCFDAKPLTGNPLQRIRAAMVTLWGTFRAFHFLYHQRCEAVIATGGFGCVPVLIAALCTGRPYFLHESNAVPGKVTRLFHCFSKRTYVTQLMPERGQVARGSTRITGFPIRQDLRFLNKSDAKHQWGFDADQPLVGILGGSQGARALTQAAQEWVKQGLPDGIQLICIVGPQAETQEYNCGDAGNQRVQWVPFVEDMGCFLSAVDLLIARSGAGSIAEIAQAGCATLLVPLPGAADDHQRANARAFADGGCAKILEQHALSNLPQRVLALLNDNESLEGMQKAMQEWSARDRIDAMLMEWKWNAEREI